jgi:hypothetical protein
MMAVSDDVRRVADVIGDRVGHPAPWRTRPQSA